MHHAYGLEALKSFCLRALSRGHSGNRLSRPRGVMLLSPPGCGKSEFAKALGHETGRPTLVLDVGTLMGSLVGETEQRTRQALRIADAMAPCVLMCDEIDKALAGVAGSGHTDSGVSMIIKDAFAAKHPDGMGRASVYPKTLLRPICSCCGKELVLGHSGRNPSFCCINGRDHKHGCKFYGYKMVSIVESVILETVEDSIFSPEFRQRLLMAANQQLEELARLPKQDTELLRQQIRKLKARQKKLATIIEEAGKRRIKVLVDRLAASERQLRKLRRELRSAEAHNAPVPGPLELEDIESALGELRGLLNSEKEIAAPVLRMLTGPIIIEQMLKDGDKRPTWIAKFTMNAVPVLREITRKTNSPTAPTWDLLTKRRWKMPIPVEVALVSKTKYDRLGTEFQKLHDEEGVTVEELAERYELSVALAKKILEVGQTGKKSEWQPCCSTPRANQSADGDPPLYVKFADIVAELHDVQKIPLAQIPDHIEKTYGHRLSKHTVRGAYTYSKTVRQKNGDGSANGHC